MTKTVPVAEFEANCVDLLEEIAGSGNDIVITRDGKPLAKVVPIESSLRGPMFGTIEIVGNIVEPIDDEWDATK
jgi:prevent-host-death family protein